MAKKALKNGLNRLLDDGCKSIPRKTIRVCGDNNWPDINAQLAEWEKKDYLKILIPPENAKDEDICIVMLKYIERESPWGDKWP